MTGPDAEGGLSGKVVKRIEVFLAQRGLDPCAFVASYGVTPDALDARLPYALVRAMGVPAAEMTGAPTSGWISR